MLKITTTYEPETVRLILEGRLAGPWLRELEQAWQSINDSMTAHHIVDLTGVTYIEEQGKTLLNQLWHEGAEFIASGCCNKPLVERMTRTRSRSQPSQRKQRA